MSENDKSLMKSVKGVVKKADIFGMATPGFNIAGHSVVRTAAGGVLSILMIFVTSVFALRKLQDLV